jgi:hypothetical protein
VINTGTRSDLIPWPPLGSDEDAKAFIDKIDANQVPVQRRLRGRSWMNRALAC